MLQKLRRSELYDRMIREYIRISNVEEFQAKEKIDRQFDELDSFINLDMSRKWDTLTGRSILITICIPPA